MSLKGIEYVLSSELRLKVLSALSKGSGTPTQLSKEVQKHLSHISRALHELEDRELVLCATPNVSKPRVYTLTEHGNEVVSEIYRRVRLNI